MSAQPLIELKHRIPYTLQNGEPTSNLIDTVMPSLKRARAIAELLEIAGANDFGTVCNEVLVCVGQAIQLELDDTAVFVEFYRNHFDQKQGGNGQGERV
ncbi:hypothetical protein PL263_04195 [Methylomonas sp. EFPC3]|uniref:hypothetical protein n=1 Tax=Methylomonas sp. EFPC3 TaxID=3021710 RepID=UPI002416EEB1|nr:hypothetical protein [Methylomonas sp. EFPC3]WFP51230.1 hypothetical protein PL263_04195 [Methylomonas sp. EFPC3]